jgi:hypothetical protein
MHFHKLFALFIIGISGAFSLPTGNSTEITVQLTVDDPDIGAANSTLAKRGFGAIGSTAFTFWSKHSFSISFSVTDTAADKHAYVPLLLPLPVSFPNSFDEDSANKLNSIYMDVEVFLAGKTSIFPKNLKCTDAKGHGHTVVCPAKYYHDPAIITAIRPLLCIEKPGNDLCELGFIVPNPWV